MQLFFLTVFRTFSDSSMEQIKLLGYVEYSKNLKGLNKKSSQKDLISQFFTDQYYYDYLN